MTAKSAPDLQNPSEMQPLKGSPQGPLGASRNDLMARCAASPFQTVLRATTSEDALCADRIALTRTLIPAFDRTMAALAVPQPNPWYLFDVVAPLVQYLLPLFAPRAPAVAKPFLIGLAGGPGVGKTTLSHLLRACLNAMLSPDIATMRVSLDDFYFSKAERENRGFAWRTLPGTHDLDRLAQFLADFDARTQPLNIPSYDLGRDRPSVEKSLEMAPDICVFDGAMVGSHLAGYDRLAKRLDTLIFLDAPLPLLITWRFGREARLRMESSETVGFSPEQMQAFWDEALAPSVTAFVTPNRARADLVVRLGPERAVCEVTASSHPTDRENGDV